MSEQEKITPSLPRTLLGWIWDRTPAGRSATHAQHLAAEHARIAERDQQVRALLPQIDTPQDFQETLNELAARWAALRQNENLAELRSLRSAYDSWMADVEDLIQTREQKQARAEAARQQMERLRSAIKQHTITPEQQAQFDRLEARLAELDASAAKLSRLWHSTQDRQVWVHQLGSGYRRLEREALALAQTLA